MAAPKGHNYSQFNTEYPGRQRKFKSHEDLWNAVIDYFEWAEQNPLEETRLLVVDKEVEEWQVPKVRATTIAGLCRHLGIWTASWFQWRHHDDPILRQVVTAAEEMIHEQKFTNAAAGLLNSTLISRDLGLADRQEVSGPGGGPIESNSQFDLSKLSTLALKELKAARKAQEKDK